jgi:hypothetical protein
MNITGKKTQSVADTLSLVWTNATDEEKDLVFEQMRKWDVTYLKKIHTLAKKSPAEAEQVILTIMERKKKEPINGRVEDGE